MGHKHAATDITSGTLAITRGGTGASTSTAALYNLINGLTASTDVSAPADYLAMLDTSASTVRKVLLSNIISSAGAATIIKGNYRGTGTYGAENPTTLTFSQPIKFLWIYRDK